jgi:L-amino acid N-acyltransferase YncA
MSGIGKALFERTVAAAEGAGVHSIDANIRVENAGAQAYYGVRISMDGRGRWMDNVFIERLWRL